MKNNVLELNDIKQCKNICDDIMQIFKDVCDENLEKSEISLRINHLITKYDYLFNYILDNIIFLHHPNNITNVIEQQLLQFWNILDNISLINDCINDEDMDQDKTSNILLGLSQFYEKQYSILEKHFICYFNSIEEKNKNHIKL